MEIQCQIVDLVEKFLSVADNLLKDGRIDSETYEDITQNKVRFLRMIEKGSACFGEDTDE